MGEGERERELEKGRREIKGRARESELEEGRREIEGRAIESGGERKGDSGKSKRERVVGGGE